MSPCFGLIFFVDIKGSFWCTGSEPDSDIVTGHNSDRLVMFANPFKLKVMPRPEARRETIMCEFAHTEGEVFAKYDEKIDE